MARFTVWITSSPIPVESSAQLSKSKVRNCPSTACAVPMYSSANARFTLVTWMGWKCRFKTSTAEAITARLPVGGWQPADAFSRQNAPPLPMQGRARSRAAEAAYASRPHPYYRRYANRPRDAGQRRYNGLVVNTQTLSALVAAIVGFAVGGAVLLRDSRRSVHVLFATFAFNVAAQRLLVFLGSMQESGSLLRWASMLAAVSL